MGKNKNEEVKEINTSTKINKKFFSHNFIRLLFTMYIIIL